MKSFIFSFISLWTWLLTFTSGFANVISLLLLNGASSHHTGNISKMAIAICEKDMETIIFMLFLVGSFFLGSILSGILFHEQKLRPQKRYGVLLISLGFLLLLITFFFSEKAVLFAISFLSGAQNAMFLYIKHYLARTSHLTGYLTDTGFALGRVLRGYKEDWQKFYFNFFQILVFLLGGLLAHLAIDLWAKNAVFLVSILYILAGIIYFTVRRKSLFQQRN